MNFTNIWKIPMHITQRTLNLADRATSRKNSVFQKINERKKDINFQKQNYLRRIVCARGKCMCPCMCGHTCTCLTQLCNIDVSVISCHICIYPCQSWYPVFEHLFLNLLLSLWMNVLITTKELGLWSAFLHLPILILLTTWFYSLQQTAAM